MRPLTHPPLKAVTVEGILHALSDPVRIAIFAGLANSDCSKTCASFSRVNRKEIPKSTLSQHFKTLREAGLVHGERVGVEMRLTSRCAEIEQRFPGLLQAIAQAFDHQQKLTRKTGSQT